MTTVEERPREFLLDPEPQKIRYTIISVDDHLIEPRHMFEGRVERKFADRAPRIIELQPGEQYEDALGLKRAAPPNRTSEAWTYEGKTYTSIGLNAVVGHKDYDKLRAEPAAFDDMRPGCFDVNARIHDMNLGGVYASINFPSLITGFAGVMYSNSQDPGLGRAVMRAWNDWFFEEWYSAYPERIIPLAITWLTDPEVGAQEIRRNAERGFKAVTLPEIPHRLGLPTLHSGYWDPIMRACEETETVVCLHVGSAGHFDTVPQDGARFEKSVTLFPALSLATCVEWLWSGLPARFPNLKIALSEGGIGWVAMLIDRLNYMADHAGSTSDSEWTGGLRASDLLLRNFWFCMLDDPSSLYQIEQIGPGKIMVETDYPHADSTWPNCQDLLHDRFTAGGLSDATIRAVTHETAAKLFRHPLPANPLPGAEIN